MTDSWGPKTASPTFLYSCRQSPFASLPTGTGAQPGPARVLDLPLGSRQGWYLHQSPHTSARVLSSKRWHLVSPSPIQRPSRCGFESPAWSQVACLTPGQSSCFISLGLTFPSVK